jgi:hypothetical protein
MGDGTEFDNVVRAGLSLGTDHRGTLAYPPEGLAEVRRTAEEGYKR